MHAQSCNALVHVRICKCGTKWFTTLTKYSHEQSHVIALIFSINIPLNEIYKLKKHQNKCPLTNCLHIYYMAKNGEYVHLEKQNTSPIKGQNKPHTTFIQLI